MLFIFISKFQGNEHNKNYGLAKIDNIWREVFLSNVKKIYGEYDNNLVFLLFVFLQRSIFFYLDSTHKTLTSTHLIIKNLNKYQL